MKLPALAAKLRAFSVSFFKQSDKPPASRKPLQRQGKASPWCYDWPLFPSLKSCGASPHLLKDARPGTRDCDLRDYACATSLRPQTRRAESLRFTPLPVYVGPRRSGESLPPVPSPQVYAESAEPFGLVILNGSNLLRLHFRQELPSAGPTRMPGQKNVTAATRLSVQVPGQGRTTPGRNQAGNLPRPTALPPMLFLPF